MNWIQELSSNTALHDNITSFMNQYGMPGLEQALQLYRDMHQTYICKTKTSISQINIYDIYYMEINRHNIDVHTEHGIYHKYGSLTNELKILSPYGFIRCAQNRIVSLNKIRNIHGNTITLINGIQIHMTRNYASSVIIAFSQCKQNKR